MTTGVSVENNCIINWYTGGLRLMRGISRQPGNNSSRDFIRGQIFWGTYTSVNTMYTHTRRAGWSKHVHSMLLKTPLLHAAYTSGSLLK